MDEDYYANLLIMQYNGKPCAEATIRALVRLVLANGLFQDVQDAYNMTTTVGDQSALISEVNAMAKVGGKSPASKIAAIENIFHLPQAVGHQLDMLAKYLGVGRSYVAEGVVNMLSDSDMFTLMRLASLNHIGNHSLSALNETIWEIFSYGLIPIESGNMAMMYFLDPNVITKPVLDAAVYYNALPRHTAVFLAGYILKKDAPYFSLISYDDEFGQVPLLVISDDGGFLCVSDEDDLLLYDDYVDLGVAITGEIRTGFTTYPLWDSKRGYFLLYSDIRQFSTGE